MGAGWGYEKRTRCFPFEVPESGQKSKLKHRILSNSQHPSSGRLLVTMNPRAWASDKTTPEAHT